jgi:hypothetical protein
VPDSGSDDASTRGAYAPPTAIEALVLARYAAGWVVAERISVLFWLKWPVGIAGIGLLAFSDEGGGLTDVRSLGVLALVLFALAWAAQWAITTAIRRLSVARRHRSAVAALDSTRGQWWPRLRAEVARVGLPSGRFATLGLVQRWARRNLRPAEVEPASRIDMRRVIGERELSEARRLLAAARLDSTQGPGSAQGRTPLT